MTTAYKQLRNGGFTLIELLIVMAILGVLAVVVLVAINPVQQLARTRDAGRTSSVTQIGHAVEAYYATHNGTYPAGLDDLVTAGELTNVPTQVNNTLGVTPCSGTSSVSGWCYSEAGTAAAIWTELESDSNREFCGASEAYVAYLTQSGRSCITCADPAADANESVCAN